MAGASGGTKQSPDALGRAVSAIGRPLRQRSTLYGTPAAPVASAPIAAAPVSTPVASLSTDRPAQP